MSEIDISQPNQMKTDYLHCSITTIDKWDIAFSNVVSILLKLKDQVKGYNL